MDSEVHIDWSPQEHRIEATRLLNEAAKHFKQSFSDYEQNKHIQLRYAEHLTARAQVHATLAVSLVRSSMGFRP